MDYWIFFCLTLLSLSVRNASSRVGKLRFPRNFKFGISLSTADIFQDNGELDLGADVFKTTLSWKSILPNGYGNKINTKAVLHYRQHLEQLLEKNLVPMVVMSDAELPDLLHNSGGWANFETVHFFEDYARVLFYVFGDLAKHWITVDDPDEICMGYEMKYRCVHNVILAHARVYRLYGQDFRSDQRGSIGLSVGSRAQLEPRELQLGLFTHSILSSEGDYDSTLREYVNEISLMEGYPRTLLPYFTPDEVILVKGSVDFIDLNHRRNNDLRSDLKYLHEHYGGDVPIVVTDEYAEEVNGELADYDRIDTMKSHLEQILLSLYEDGTNVVAYIAPNLAKSQQIRIVEGNPARKFSTKFYENVIATHQLDLDYLNRPKSLFT